MPLPLRDKRRWRQAFGTYERAVATTSLIFSFLSLLLSLVLVAIPQARIPQFIVARDIAIVSGLVGLSLLLLYKYAHREGTIRSQFQLLSDQFKNSHAMVHTFRTELFQHYFHPDGCRSLTPHEHAMLRRVCAAVTEGVRTTLTEYFTSQGIAIGHDLSISVKMIVSTEELLKRFPGLAFKHRDALRTKPQWVITVYRDHYTYMHHQERETLSDVYDIDKNTAFHHIIMNRSPCFCCNDLQARGSSYLNENPDWRQQYNATLVVPIRYQSRDRDAYACYGLLAVDSRNKPGRALYNEAECRHIMGHAADLLATFFLALELVRLDPAEVTEDSNAAR